MTPFHHFLPPSLLNSLFVPCSFVHLLQLLLITLTLFTGLAIIAQCCCCGSPRRVRRRIAPRRMELIPPPSESRSRVPIETVDARAEDYQTLGGLELQELFPEAKKPSEKKRQQQQKEREANDKRKAASKQQIAESKQKVETAPKKPQQQLKSPDKGKPGMVRRNDPDYKTLFNLGADQIFKTESEKNAEKEYERMSGVAAPKKTQKGGAKAEEPAEGYETLDQVQQDKRK